MPQFTFPIAELTAEHKRTAVREVVLQVDAREQPAAADATWLHGNLQVTGQLAMELVNTENKLRLGQMVELKLTAPDGRFTRLSVLLIELQGIEAPAPKQRVYRWAFLVPVKPGHDPQGMFRRPGEPVPIPPWQQEPASSWVASPHPATLKADPCAQEITLGELLAQMGSTSADRAVRFTAEGGFVPG